MCRLLFYFWRYVVTYYVFITRHPIKQDQGCFSFCNRAGLKFTHGGVNLHSHTRRNRDIGERMFFLGDGPGPGGTGWAHHSVGWYKRPSTTTRRRLFMLPPAEDTPTDKGNTKAKLSVCTHAPKTHRNTKQQGGISIRVFFCGYCYCLLYVRDGFPETLVCAVRVLLYRNRCPRVATTKRTTRNTLRLAGASGPYLWMNARSVCLVFVGVHCAIMCMYGYVYIIWLLGVGLDWKSGYHCMVKSCVYLGVYTHTQIPRHTSTLCPLRAASRVTFI